MILKTFGIGVVFVAGLYTGLFYANGMRTPETYVALTNTPPCATPLATLPGKQVLYVVRRNSTVSLQTRFDGTVLGDLISLDIYTQTATLPNRPPVGWKIGAR